MVRLLNRGFPLWAALDIARDRSIIGGQYIVVGDSNVNVVQTESVFPMIFEIEPNGDEYELTIITYASGDTGIGGLVTPRLSEERRSYLASGVLTTQSLTKEELERHLALEDVPIRTNGQLKWSYSVDVDEL
ncbi:hypothetical protein [Haladaptatus sp. NG-WS-4]